MRISQEEYAWTLSSKLSVMCYMNSINDTQGEIRGDRNIFWVVTEDFIER